MSRDGKTILSSRAFARGLGAVGRFMITTGVVMLLLVAYQLWGTNLQTNRSQDQLREEFEAGLAGADDPTVKTTVPSSTEPADDTEPATTVADDGPPRTTPPELAEDTGPIEEGRALGRISIPSIGLHNFYIVQGTTVDQLKRGAGHYSESPLPGQKGNAAVAGHRTTYGAPFHNIDKVAVGDLVMVETFQGRFRYEVSEQRIVEPSDVSVLDDVGDNRLTLTACHPKFSAKQRIIVFAVLVGNPVPKLPGQDEPPTTTTPDTKGKPTAAPVQPVDSRSSIDDFTSEPIFRFPGAWWGVACMALWLVVRLLAWLGRRSHRYPRIIPYLVGTPVCLVFLFFFFESFSYEALTHTLGIAV